MKKKIVPAILIIILFLVLLSLGFWQLDRAEQKQKIVDNINIASNTPAQHILVKDINKKEHYNILLTGRYLGDKQFIYDNQIVNGRAGYFVLTPFMLTDSQKIILINRGFIAWINGREMQDISVNKAIITIKGKISKSIQRIKLANNPMIENFPILLQSINFTVINQFLHTQVIENIILLNQAEKNGYQRQWQPFYGSVAKHMGYAFQWFLMALALMIIAIIMFKNSYHSNKNIQ